jgi:adenylate cyclase
MYGNVGVPTRLTFSAFGVVLHEVDRLEKLGKELGEPVLASETFVNAAGEGHWRDLGTHNLRGVGCPVNVRALGAA